VCYSKELKIFTTSIELEMEDKLYAITAKGEKFKKQRTKKMTINPRFVVKHIGWSLKKANARPKPAKELVYPAHGQTEKL
jgi:hypothetical protein